MVIDRWENLAAKKEVGIPDGDTILAQSHWSEKRKLSKTKERYTSLTIRLVFSKLMFLFIIKVICSTLKSAESEREGSTHKLSYQHVKK